MSRMENKYNKMEILKINKEEKNRDYLSPNVSIIQEHLETKHPSLDVDQAGDDVEVELVIGSETSRQRDTDMEESKF